MMQTRGKMSSRPSDATFEVSPVQNVKVWMNQEVFTPTGNLRDGIKFTGDEEIHFLTLNWPDPEEPITAISHWQAYIEFQGTSLSSDFVRSTAEDIGLNKFEMVKSCIKKCFTDFGAFLLEVTSHRVKLGHCSVQSAEGAKAKKEKVERVLFNLVADTDYLYMDVKVTWDVTITAAPSLPALEPSGQSPLVSIGTLGGSTQSLVSDGLGSVTSTSPGVGQDVGEFNWSKIGPDHLLVRVLKEVWLMKDSITGLEEKMSQQLSGVQDMLQIVYRNQPALGGKSRLKIDNPESDGDSANNRSDNITNTSAIPLGNGPTYPSEGVHLHNTQRSQQHDQRSVHTGVHSGTDSAGRVENRSSNRAVNGPSRQVRAGGRSSPVQATDVTNGRRETHPENTSSRFSQNQNTSSRDRNGAQSTPRTDSSVSSANSNIYDGGSVDNRRGETEIHRSAGRSSKQHSSEAQSRKLPHTTPERKDSGGTKDSENRNRAGGSPRQDYARQNSSPTARPSYHDRTPRQTPNAARHSEPSSGGNEQRNTEDKTKRSFSQTPDTPSHSHRRTGSTISEMDMTIEIGSDSEAKLVREAVDRAYEEDAVKPPKAKSFDTMLCLDISESMKTGRAFEEMKRTVLSFIDGVDDVVSDSGVEENMGLVTFGGRANVIQNLTNDFSRIRDAIDNMQPGGKSPFVEALLVAMAAFVRKGGIVSVSGEWDVRPRIIFISDGHPTESTEDNGRDSANNLTNVRMSLSRMLMSFKTSENFNKVYPIVFIPVGANADKKYMRAMAGLCEGEYVEPQNVRQLCHYYRVQETIGKVLVCLKREAKNTTPERLKATVDALTPELSDDEKQKVLEVVSRELDNPNRARNRRTKPNDLEYVFEDTEKVMAGERLPLGTRVIRGPDWEWDNQDYGGPGTVINHHEKHSWHWVNWDGGDYNCYPYSKRRGYHIWKTENHPRLKRDNEPLEIGMTVKKGPDWKAADAEEGQGVGVGVIIRKSESKGKVVVQWSTGVRQTCSWSQNGLREVEYYDPDEKEAKVPQTAAKSSSTAPSSEPQEARTGFISKCEHGQWQWRDVDGTWKSYDKKLNQEIEAQYKKRPHTSCLLTRDGKQRRVMFRRQMEKVVDDGTECEVQRIPAE